MFFGGGEALPAPQASVPVAEPGTLPPPLPLSQPGRRIVGVLVTYSWKNEGQLFPLCEGRNIVGRDATESDIAIPQDPALSAKNTYIVYRKNFMIADAMSMGGTDMDGEPVEEQKRLRNYSTIRTGSTYWTFISFDPDPQEIGG